MALEEIDGTAEALFKHHLERCLVEKVEAPSRIEFEGEIDVRILAPLPASK